MGQDHHGIIVFKGKIAQVSLVNDRALRRFHVDLKEFLVVDGLILVENRFNGVLSRTFSCPSDKRTDCNSCRTKSSDDSLDPFPFVVVSSLADAVNVVAHARRLFISPEHPDEIAGQFVVL